MDIIVLLYIGGGNWLPFVPTKDLTADEAEQCGGVEYLISTGLYMAAEVEE